MLFREELHGFLETSLMACSRLNWLVKELAIEDETFGRGWVERERGGLDVVLVRWVGR